MTLDQAKSLQYGDHIWISTEWYKRRGVPVAPKCVKVNGRPRVWKRQPDRVEIPYKYGLYDYGVIRQYDLAEWHLTEADAIAAAKTA